jgi:hypothetical protein
VELIKFDHALGFFLTLDGFFGVREPAPFVTFSA